VREVSNSVGLECQLVGREKEMEAEAEDQILFKDHRPFSISSNLFFYDNENDFNITLTE
jgi:hypothetical protein